MMGTKLRVALCALLPLLLLTDLGSAEQDVAKVDTKAPAPDSVPASSPESTTHPALALNGSDTNPSSNSTSSLRSNTTTDRNATSQIPISQRDNDTSVVSPSVSVVPENSANVTERSTSQPQILPSESNANITHILSTTNTTNATNATNATRATTTTTTTATTTTGPPHTAHGVHVDTVTTNTSNVPASLPTDPISSSKHSTTHSFTFAPTPEPPKPDITAATNTSTRTSSTASPTISSQKPPKSESETLTTPQASHSEGPQDQPKATVTTPSNPSVQAKAHADSPPQLKVGGDTTTIHESPTLDPLLAGLVSAFIITAVIITLLLFLKLRRRDNRPEFRRLQDLPMDDMMEDTPLSMYSY